MVASLTARTEIEIHETLPIFEVDRSEIWTSASTGSVLRSGI